MKTAPFKGLLHADMLLHTVILFLVEFVRGAVQISFLSLYGTRHLGLDLDVIGAAITASFLTDAIVKLAIGYLLDRFAVRTVVSASILLCAAGILLIGFADVPWLFITAAALFGFGLSPIWIVCLTRIREESRGVQMGFLYTIWLAGMGTGPVVVNLVLDVSLSAAFWTLAIVALAGWLLSLLLAGGREIHIDRVPFLRQISILGARLREMKILLPGMVLQTLGAGMLLPILPTFASKNLGMTSTHYSVLLTLGGVFTVIGLIPMGKLSDHFGKKWFLVTGFLLFGIVLNLLTFQPSYGLALIWAILLGLSYAAVLPAWNALLAAYVPPGQQGLGWGVFSTVEGLGAMVGPYVGGVLATSLGEAWVVGLAGLLFVLISLFYVFFPFRTFRGE
ncbi:MFS transporter [Cohnella caldifontis]|uniref:MFS transporter n=1 Tax=Cohnella caldifontis TaxID=3027471 RepID=UPI0023EC0FB3|nr:MFS transporter [Cohnella sp. YIM B05605]